MESRGVLVVPGDEVGDLRCHGYRSVPQPATAVFAVDRIDDLLDRMTVLERMAEGSVTDDRVAVAAPDPLSGDVAVFLELVEDPLDRALGDADQIADVALAEFGVAADRDQHVGVVREERPRSAIGLSVSFVGVAAGAIGSVGRRHAATSVSPH